MQSSPMTIKDGLRMLEEKRHADYDRETGSVCGMVNNAVKRNVKQKRQEAFDREALVRQNTALEKALSDMRYSRFAGWFLAGMATMGLIISLMNF